MGVRETLELDVSKSLTGIGQIDRSLTAASSRFETNLNRAVGSLGKVTAGGDTGGLGRLSAGLDDVQVKSEQARQSTQRHDASLRELGSTSGKVALAFSAAMGGMIYASLRFEQSLSTVAAVSNATAGQLERLRSSAIVAGQATVFSAKEAADAQGELAKAGVSVSDILGGALRGSLDLAAAGQLGLADAATIAAQAMQIFKLRGTDVTHIADVLAAGANKSSASVGSLGEGLANVGGLAALLGLTLEDTVGALALLDQNAVRGAEGGTALRSALLALVAPSQVQADEMTRLGISFFDARGKFVGLDGVAKVLRGTLGALTDEQRNATLAILFGSYGIRAANVLYQTGEQDIRKWAKAVNDSGAAGRVAAVQMDNLAGDIEGLKGSIETALIKSGGQATVVLRSLAQGATSVVNGISELPGPVQATAVGLGALTTAGFAALSFYGTFAPRITAAKEALMQHGAAGQFAAENMGKLAKGALALTSFFAIGPQLRGLAGDFTGAGAAAGAMAGSLFGIQGAAVGTVLGAIAGEVGVLGDEAEATKQEIVGLTQAMTSLTNSELRRSLSNLGDTSLVSLADQLDVVEERFKTIARTSPAQAERVLEQLRRLRDEGGKPIVPAGVIEDLEKSLERQTVAYAKGEKAALNADAANRALVESLTGEGGVAGATDEAGEAMGKFVEKLIQGLPSVNDFYGQAIQKAGDLADANAPEKILANFQGQLEGMARWKDEIQRLMSEGMTGLARIVFEQGPIAGAALVDSFKNAGPGVLEGMNKTAAEIDRFLGTLSSDLANNWGPTFYDNGYGAGAAAGDGMVAGMDAAYWRLRSSAVGMAASVMAAFTSGLQIGSPSKVFRYYGHMVGEGLVLGLGDMERYVDVAGNRLAMRTIPGAGSGTGASSGGAMVGPITVNVVGVSDARLARAAGRAAGEGFADGATKRTARIAARAG